MNMKLLIAKLLVILGWIFLMIRMVTTVVVFGYIAIAIFVCSDLIALFHLIQIKIIESLIKDLRSGKITSSNPMALGLLIWKLDKLKRW